MLNNKFWESARALLGIDKTMSIESHPQTDGLIESTSCTLEEMLRHNVGDEHINWDEMLSCAGFAINCFRQEVIQDSPLSLIMDSTH